LKNKLLNLVNNFVFYSIQPKKNSTNWMILIFFLIVTLLPYALIIRMALPAESIMEILYWQSATFFLSNLLLPVRFSLAVMAIHLFAIILLPSQSNLLEYNQVVFVLILLVIVYAFTYAFTSLKRWDMQRVFESIKLVEAKEARINSLFDNEFYAIIVHDNGIIRDVNETFVRLFDYSLAEVTGKDIFTLLFRNELNEQGKALSLKFNFNVEKYAYRKSGEKFPIEIIGKKYAEGDENLKICFIRDITSKKEMYLELTKHRNYLQQILDALPHAIFVKNINTLVIQTANRLALTEFNYPDQTGQIQGYANHSVEYQRAIELVKKTKLPITLEESRILNDGNEKYLEVYIHPFLNDQGDIHELLEIITDITVRKKIEERLKNTLKELRDIRDAMDEHAIVSITDALGNITYVNDKFVQVSGYSREELIGKNHRIIKSREHSPEFYGKIWDTITSGRIWQGEIRNLSKNGSYYWVSSTIVPFLNENGKPYQYVSIRTEITEQKKIAEQLKVAKEEAERANRAKSTFLANMSHEIRTPLNAVLGMAELAMSSGLTHVQTKYISLIQSSGVNLLNIINEILDFSKIEADKLVVQNIPFQLRQMLFSTLNIFTYEAREKGLIMSVYVDPDIPDYLTGDPQRIRQIIINLVGNALKFTEAGYIVIDIETLSFDVKNREILIKFTVADTGIGIPTSKQKLIFESFTQEDSTISRKFGGTGLGTTISRELATIMGGAMGVISPLRHYTFNKGGVGSEFWFTIKCHANLDRQTVFEKHLTEKNIQAMALVKTDTNKDILENFFKNINGSLSVFSPENADNLTISSDRVDVLLIERPDTQDSLKQLLASVGKKINLDKTNVVMILDYENFCNTSLLSDMGIKYFLYLPITKNSLWRMFNFLMPDQPDTPTRNLQEIMKPVTFPREKENISEDNTMIQVLIAEDNEINQFLLKTVLENIGCSSSLASNGVEALQILKKYPNKFDMIFMDLQMPEMNGFETAEEIRKSISKTIPIIAVTANAFIEDREKAMALGMNDFIAKPYTKDELKMVLKKYLNQTPK